MTAKAIEALEKIADPEGPENRLMLKALAAEALASLRSQPAPDAEGLAEALEPFAAIPDHYILANEARIRLMRLSAARLDNDGNKIGDHEWRIPFGVEITVGDLRRARARLAAYRNGGR